LRGYYRKADVIGTGQRRIRNQRQPLRLQSFDFSTTAASLSRTTGFLGFNHRFSFERPQPVIGIENERLINGLLALFFQPV
jgi:hypothetical protein